MRADGVEAGRASSVAAWIALKNGWPIATLSIAFRDHMVPAGVVPVRRG